MNIEDMSIEITRKCNMQCCHCLRGTAQRVSITENMLWRAFHNIDSIGTLVITGGEPSLAVPQLGMLRDALLQNRVYVESIYMVTNGKYITEPFMEACERLSWLVNPHDEYSFSVEYSNDYYHNGEWEKANKWIELAQDEIQYTWFKPRETKDAAKVPYELINQGRAEGHGDRDLEWRKWEFSTSFSGGINLAGRVYVSAKGEVLPFGNGSYATMKKEKLAVLGETHDTLYSYLAQCARMAPEDANQEEQYDSLSS